MKQYDNLKFTRNEIDVWYLKSITTCIRPNQNGRLKNGTYYYPANATNPYVQARGTIVQLTSDKRKRSKSSRR